MAAFQLPRQINTKSNLQAASPAFETKRLFSLLGVGVEVIMGFAYLLITISTFSIFIGLYNSIKERQPDLAIMRVMGATRSKLFACVLLEGCSLTLAGSVVGLLLGHAALSCLPLLATDFARININAFEFTSNEWLILAGSLVLGILCSLVPGVQSYKTDIHKVLSGAV
jgi:putative ABC transport system permease protein